MYLVLIVSFIISATALAQKPLWSFDRCGTYKAHGILKLNSKKQYVLALNPKTKEYSEVMLLTAKAKDVLKYINKEVEVEIAVYKIKLENNKAILEKIKPTQKKTKHGLRIVTAKDCRPSVDK